jgi:hypothetical protein
MATPKAAPKAAKGTRVPCLLLLALFSLSASAGLVGDSRAVPAEELLSPDVLAAAEEVLLEVERSSSRTMQPQLLGLTRVLAASKQVVAGVKWELELELSPTTCRRSADTRIDPAAELRERCKQNDQRVVAPPRAVRRCPRASPSIAEPAQRPRSRSPRRLRLRRFSRVFEATALHRAWIKEAPWTITVSRFRDAGSGEWK